MQYSINLSEESDHFLRQLCDPGTNSHSKAISVEDFLSALVEEHLDELFVRRERPKTEKNKKVAVAVRSAKERAKTWREAAIATQTALEAVRKLVDQLQWSQSRIRRRNRVNSLNFHAEAARCEVKGISETNQASDKPTPAAVSNYCG